MPNGIVACALAALALAAAPWACAFQPGMHPGGSSGGAATGGGAGGAAGSRRNGGSGGLPPFAFDAGPPPPRNDGSSADASCAAAMAMATLVREPVDIIVVIDNSQSMTNEIQAVEQNIGVNFATILAASDVDYRVILISRHGSAQNQQSICVSMPLSGAPTCTPPPAAPVNGPRFFQYSIEIGSNNSFGQILAGYRRADEFNLAPQGWSQWLRAGARKVFLEITDDEATDLTSAEFDTALLALDPAMFGTAAVRRYAFHSIVGLIENTPATAAWPSTDPIQTQTCTGNGGDVVEAGIQYQQLSVLTAGLRFPLCQYASFDVVFQAIAQDVVSGSQIACEFPIPPPPAGRPALDLDKVAVGYTPGDGTPPQTFAQVTTPDRCIPDAFYVAGTAIVLCPQSCTKVQQDPLARVNVLFTCQSTIVP